MLVSHGGKFGDLVYSLPAIKHMGGGHLTLYPNPGTGMAFSTENIETIRPLLEAQDYIKSVRFSPNPVGLNFDQYRNHWRNNLNISDIIHNWLGLPFASRTEPWLQVEPKRVAPVVFARCPRYHNGNFPWGRAMQRYGKEAVFIGLPHEHRDFCNLFGNVAYHPTRNFLEVAQVIAGADLFVGNQSCPRAIAEGFKISLVQETALDNDNCHWGRCNAWYGYRADVFLPDLTEAKLANLINTVSDRTVITEDRLRVIAESVRETERLPGEMVECGCYRGGSAKLITSLCPSKKLYVFDTFSGLPTDETLAGVHKAGDFAANRAEVEEFLKGYNVEIRAGVFPGTANGLEEKKFSFVHLDLDLYESTLAALKFFWPRMVEGGVLLIDDVDWSHTPGINKALAESGLLHLVERPERQQGRIRRKELPHSPQKIDLSIIVISWKRPHLLRDTLASIKSKMNGLNYRLVVADNESSEATRAVIAEVGVDHVWHIARNRGINWPVEFLFGPMLNEHPSEFVMICDADLHFGRDLKIYLDFLRENEDIAFAKGLDSPEHETFGEREYRGEKWVLKKTERGGGVIMKTETLTAAFPLPTHKLIDFDWHLCDTKKIWGVLPATCAHTGWRESTREDMIEAPEKYILNEKGEIVPNSNYRA